MKVEIRVGWSHSKDWSTYKSMNVEINGDKELIEEFYKHIKKFKASEKTMDSKFDVWVMD